MGLFFKCSAGWSLSVPESGRQTSHPAKVRSMDRAPGVLNFRRSLVWIFFRSLKLSCGQSPAGVRHDHRTGLNYPLSSREAAWTAESRAKFRARTFEPSRKVPSGRHYLRPKLTGDFRPSDRAIHLAGKPFYIGTNETLPNRFSALSRNIDFIIDYPYNTNN